MNILVANDDGFESEGIKALAEVLSSENHKVIVVAPDGNRSAFSHSLTISRSLTFKKVYISDKFESYSVDGTPADCVKFALHYFDKEKFDMVCSGINMGNNLGSDIQYSGTVAAAMEANFFGLKSIAFSNTGRKDFNFAINAQIIKRIFNKLVSIASDKYTLNVNLPNYEPKGIKFAPIGIQKYSDSYVKKDDGTYMLVGEPTEVKQDENCDVELSRHGYVTITPVLYDRTDYKAMNTFGDIEL